MNFAWASGGGEISADGSQISAKDGVIDNTLSRPKSPNGGVSFISNTLSSGYDTTNRTPIWKQVKWPDTI